MTGWACSPQELWADSVSLLLRLFWRLIPTPKRPLICFPRVAFDHPGYPWLAAAVSPARIPISLEFNPNPHHRVSSSHAVDNLQITVNQIRTFGDTFVTTYSVEGARPGSLRSNPFTGRIKLVEGV